MKRVALLLPLAASAVIWARQIRFERRLVRRQGAFERETTRGMRHYAKGVNECLEYGAESWNRWGDDLVREIKRVVKVPQT